MDLLKKFQELIAEKELFSKQDHLFLAVSGGLDSSVLCDLCYRSDFDFTIAHCNFRLRGEESTRDEQFVRTLGKKYIKEVLVAHFDTEAHARENKISIQVAARELRYEWLSELTEQPTAKSSARYILTAHHLDDNIETLLMHFFRGTGIAGLRAIPIAQGKIVRPLLFAKKDELKAYAASHHVQWIEDSSNESDKYSRNYFRHQVIPVVQKIFPQVIGNLASNIERFRDIEFLYRQSITLHKKKLLEQRGEEVHIPVLKLKKSEPLHAICYEIIKDYGFTSAQLPELIDLLDSDSGKYIHSFTHRIIKNRNWLIIAPKHHSESEMVLIEAADHPVPFSLGTLHLQFLHAENYKLQSLTTIAQLDATDIRFPLILRKWKKGDYFYPLGMTKKKKLARFLIDEKISKTAKEKTWVIEMNKKIIWIVGTRIDNRFKITPQTKHILKIEMRVR